MANTKKRITRIRDKAKEMYEILNEFRHVIYVKGGQPDDIMNVAAKALRILREIDLDLEPQHNIKNL